MLTYRFANPFGLFFLILPLLCFVSIFVSRYVFKKGVKITGVSSFKRDISLNVVGYFFSLFLILLGMSLIAFSLSKPQSGMKKEKIVSEGIDIMISLDVSGSMTTQDYIGQSRIDGAKRIISDFIDKRKGDRIGLVTFGQSSFLKCPPTVNYTLLKSIISNIKINPQDKMASSTAIGIGLASGLNRLIQLKDNTKSESKVVILVTDGINNAGEITPEAAKDIAVSSKIKVYTVGVGSNEEVDIAMLKDIAEKTNAKSFHAKTSGELPGIFEEIDRLEKHKIETIEYTRFKDIGYSFALAGIIMMLIGLFMNNFLFKRLG